MREYLAAEAHKAYHIETILNYLQALDDVYTIWQIHLVDSSFSSGHNESPETKFPLSPQQMALFTKFTQLLRTRQGQLRPSARSGWRRYQLLLGKPGAGKSQVLKRLIATALKNEYKVALCAPLMILVSHYRDLFNDEVYADTVHTMFHIPIDTGDQHEVNYRLGSFDLLVVEEASMINYENFALMHGSLEKQVRRPFVIAAGDRKQQPPLATVQDKSILANPDLYQAGESHSLYHQFWCRDKNYQILDLLHHSAPSQSVLENNTQLWTAMAER